MELKKVELHVHLDGSMRPETYAELKGISLKEAKTLLIAKDKSLDLNEYLDKFSAPVSLMQTKDNLTRVSRELAEDLFKDNCIYAEVRFAPNKHTTILTLDEVVTAVLEGLKYSKIPINLLLCMMRGDSFQDNKKIIDLAKKYLNNGVVGIDLAGAEANYKTSSYKELFDYANSLNIPFTIHAGEADGVESIMSAIEFGASRIGHGVRAIESNLCLTLLKENNILLEVCPTSNIQTNIYKEIKNHSIKKLIDFGIDVSISTDNRTVSNIDLNSEYKKLKEAFAFSIADYNKMNINALKHAFITEEEKEKLIKKIKEN